MKYDFIIVGAGPSGVALTWKLSQAVKPPKILLVEAGGDNSDHSAMNFGERVFTRRRPGWSWGYTTTPQSHLNGRQLDVDRGKGLGGSTAINFAVYQMPHKGDFAEIARILEDDDWAWDRVLHRHKQLENYFVPANDDYRSLIQPTPGVHGANGPLRVGFPEEVEKQAKGLIDVLKQSVYAQNMDTNDGNGLGFSIVPGTLYKGVRATARDLLSPTPENVTILTNTVVQRVLVKGKQAVGIMTAGGQEYFASRDVILSAGALDTPKLLLLSGIGPKQHLDSIGISVIHESARVGKGLKDHLFCSWNYTRTADTSDRPSYYRDPDRQLEAKNQWKEDGSGDMSRIAAIIIMGLAKNDKIYQSSEFHQLSSDVRRHLLDETVPLYEFAMNGPNMQDILSPSTSIAMASMSTFLYNARSEGEVLLQSSNPDEPPLIEANMFAHPFDRRVAIEATKAMLEFAASEPFAKDTIGVVDGPRGTTDEDILEFWRRKATSAWHLGGTAKMGKPDDPQAVVGTDFRILGLQGLRIVDMSIAPILINAHTQCFAYLIGLTAAQKLQEEYHF